MSGAQADTTTERLRRRTLRFGPIEVAYDDRVLVPRPWTLGQSRWAADLAADAEPGPILELCCGAGHIGLAAAVESNRAIVQVDADPVAAAYARANAAAAGWAGRTEVRCATVDTALDPDERFPLVIADPPYLPRREIGRFPDDPVAAIDGGPDGLDLVRTCLAVAARHLLPGAPVVLQVAGPRQADEVEALVRRSHVGEPAADRLADLSVEDRRVVDDERALVLLVRNPSSTT